MKLIYPREFKVKNKILRHGEDFIFGESTGGIYLHFRDRKSGNWCIDSPFESDDKEVLAHLNKFIDFIKEINK